jgi:hypothetical protein
VIRCSIAFPVTYEYLSFEKKLQHSDDFYGEMTTQRDSRLGKTLLFVRRSMLVGACLRLLEQSGWLDGIEHGNHILGRHIGQDIVNLPENEIALPAEDAELPADVICHLHRAGQREDGLSITSSTPQCDPVPELAPGSLGLHTAG